MTIDPSAALDMIKAEPYALVLSDVKMPKLSGIELMKKAREIDPSLHFIIITAVDSASTAIKAVKMGAYDYIIKPFDIEEIIESVNNAIRDREKKETPPAIQTIANDFNAEGKSEEKREIETAIQVLASENGTIGSNGERRMEPDIRIEQPIHEIINGLAQDFAQSYQIATEFFGTDRKVYSEMVIEHSERVEFLAVNVAKRMKLPPGLRAQIAAAAFLHDIGKIGMAVPAVNPNNYLSKQDKQIYEKHSTRGEALVEPMKFLRTASWFIRHHHEKYGGGGYPDGLKGEKIPIGSRIIAVADAYDRFKNLLQQGEEDSEKKARAYISKGSGKLFDPTVVKRFLTYLDELDEENSGFLQKQGKRLRKRMRAPNNS